LKIVRILVVVVIAILGFRPALGSDNDVVLEIGVAKLGPSSSSSATWGWWNPGKYDEWTAETASELELSDLRLRFSGKTYTVVLEGEWLPTLEAGGRSDQAFTTDELVQDLSFETSVYDLGFGQWFGKNRRTGVLPWIGATYMRLRERRTTILPPGSNPAEVTDGASANLWGVVIGADGSYRIWSTLDLTGRLLLRWATGTRNAQIASQDPGGDGTAEVSDSVDAGMWGLDIGVRWNATKLFWLEAGWRYRDQTYDGGPATYGGPQIKAAYRF
jgi:hypothetical protein